ncbi:MAG: acyl carrier protein [Acetatifactor sp.]|nr:acyl carrier protein [Acetatifactor sp.]
MIDRVKKCIITVCKGDVLAEQISNTSKLVEDFYFDSIMMIELIVELENEFDIEIDETDLVFEEFNVFESLVKIVEKTVG